MKSKISLFLMGLLVVSCGGVWGTINHFNVTNAFSLKSVRDNQVVNFEVGPQNVAPWSVNITQKNNQQQVFLVRGSDKAKFDIAANGITGQYNKVASHDATSAWQERWVSCSVQEPVTVCNQQGCWTQYQDRPGSEFIRERTEGTYDDYDVNLANSTQQTLADLNVTIDNTSIRQELIYPCR